MRKVLKFLRSLAACGMIGAKADHAARVSLQIAAGEAEPGVLAEALEYEWHSLIALMTLSVLNVVLGVWQPSLKMRRPATQPG